MRVRLVALLLFICVASIWFAGCTGEREESDSDVASDSSDVLQCVHPWPCRDGSEWPVDLDGPFEALSPTKIVIPTDDGILLSGWLLRPELPGDVKAPAVVWSTAYFGQFYDTPGAPSRAVAHRLPDVLPVDHLVRSGYAVALVNVRGTGPSEGCFQMWGAQEQRDQATLVEWIADRPWSNGRVGMGGISYSAATAWSAAIQAPEALKAIATGGIVSDMYTLYHSPQGAAVNTGGAWQASWLGAFSLPPPLLADPMVTASHAERVHTRACPELAPYLQESVTGYVGDDRDPSFWSERRLIRDFANVTAAVFLFHGFQDLGFHKMQEGPVWASLEKAPKRMLEGQWGHEPPDSNAAHPAWALGDWPTTLVAWFDFWLKGLGEAPDGIGQVEYQDDGGAWLNTTAWPPADAHAEALYVGASQLERQPAEVTSTFHSVRRDDGPQGALCDALDAEAMGLGLPEVTALVRFSEPVVDETLVAGNPFAYLQVESDQSGGLLAVDLFRVPPDARCDPSQTGQGQLRPFPHLVQGTADLRFHAGNHAGSDFPTGSADPVRVDLANLAARFAPGDRLALVLSHGDSGESDSGPYAPMLRLHGGPDAAGSHLVVPVVEGGFGGGPGLTEYPARPHT